MAKTFNVVALAIYFVVITALGSLAYRAAYWPTLFGSVIIFMVIYLRSTLSVAQSLSLYIILCLLVMISSIVSGLVQYRQSGSPFRYLFGEFLESQFWEAIYFYIPILLMCLLFVLAVKAVYQR